MPKSTTSFRSLASEASQHAADDEALEIREAQAQVNTRLNASRSDNDFASHMDGPGDMLLTMPESAPRGRLSISQRRNVTERTPLLSQSLDQTSGNNTRNVSAFGTPRDSLARSASFAGSLRGSRLLNHSRHPSGSFRVRLASTIRGNVTPSHEQHIPAAIGHASYDGREWYNQFTSTDWVRDSIADAYRVKELRSRRDWKGRLITVLDGAQGWLLVAVIGIIVANVTFFVTVTESTLYDYKYGYCGGTWWHNNRKCCKGADTCPDWHNWSELVPSFGLDPVWVEFAFFNAWVILFSMCACIITLQTKTTVSSAISLSTLDENLGADRHNKPTTEGRHDSSSSSARVEKDARFAPTTYYPAAGSGVAEVKVILSGFVLHGYLGVRTLVAKTLGLILSVASGLSLGKEGPYVHIAACIGNIASRFVPKYRDNDGKRRGILSAAAAAGVAVAFGAPIAGVLFSLEEVSYYFPPKVLFRTFFCCIIAALSLRFLNPYGTDKIVLFQVRYLIDWKLFEIVAFILLGICGGFLGALFIKGARAWGTTFRRLSLIKKRPLVEVFLVALATGLCSFWNRYTRLPVAELLYELAAPCDAYSETGLSLCPTKELIPDTLWYLLIAFVIKAALTLVTFGLKLPAGIYVPSMVVGGILGRMVGHSVQLLLAHYPDSPVFASCAVHDDQILQCVTPGVYALVAAGATMCGVTRLSVTLAVILFELTGSLEYVLPFSLGIMFAKWTADMLEPASIYDLLTDMNAYPYLDAKIRPVFTSDLGDITAPPDPARFIDISISPLVPAKELRAKLEGLHAAGELDGGLPILKDRVLVGLIPAPDLEFALDRLDGEEDTALCRMGEQDHWPDTAGGNVLADSDPDLYYTPSTPGAELEQFLDDLDSTNPTDFTPFIDSAPVSLDIGSPLDLVFECFVKLGLRYICVLRQGKFCGMVHKKAFVRYVKQVEKDK